MPQAVDDRKAGIGPWPDVATARLFLTGLATDGIAAKADAWRRLAQQETAVAAWLIKAGVGPIAAARCRAGWSSLLPHIQRDAFSAVAESSVFQALQGEIEAAFAAVSLPFVWLKGAALARAAYDDPAWRTMSDLDIWIKAEDMAQAFTCLQEIGMQAWGKESRPPSLQQLSLGEIQFYREGFGMVELHWSPFPGWWLRRTAVVDDDGIWQRKERLPGTAVAHQLAAEDMVIHLAVHMAINHQFGLMPVRSLLDLALTARARPVDWRVVAERAQRWRVATAVWQVLALLNQLIVSPGVEDALRILRPSRLRRALLARLVSAESVLAGRDIRRGRQRFMLLLLLVDRPRDMVKLMVRTLWPERAWLQARYPDGVSRRKHLWQVIRYGRI